MAIISALRRILNDSPGTATNIDYNFQVLEDFVNTEVVTITNPPAITGPIVVGPPVADTHAATKGYVDGLWFTGMMVEFAGTTLAPAEALEWALCDGSTQSTTDPKFIALFNRIQYLYGGSGGSFKLPDYRARVGVGRSDLGTDVIFDTVGKTGGLRDNELLLHAHTVPIHGHGMSGGVGASDRSLAHSHSVGTLAMQSAGHHTHGWDAKGFLYNDVGDSGFALVQGSGGIRSATWAGDGGHAHPMVGITGGEGAPDHLHANTFAVTNAAAFNVTNAGAGTTLTDKNLPPYLVVTRIIKL